MSEHTVVLLSGGLDSAVLLAMLQADARSVSALTVDYGQRHGVEMEKAVKLASHYGVDHRLIRVDLRAIGGSALTSEVAVPKDRDSGGGGIPATYVPARNTILLSLALAWAEVLDATALAIGVNAVDYSGYPDCRREFLRSFERLSELATKAGVERRRSFEVLAPLVGMSKSEIIRRGFELSVPFELTHSCYDPVDSLACGRCDSCVIRRRGFASAGVSDPTRYVVTTVNSGS